MKIIVIENKFLHEIDIIDAEWITKQFGIKNPFCKNLQIAQFDYKPSIYSIGPNFEPCGTPTVTGTISLHSFSIFTEYDLQLK